jgi:hypothetical protein
MGISTGITGLQAQDNKITWRREWDFEPVHKPQTKGLTEHGQQI